MNRSQNAAADAPRRTRTWVKVRSIACAIGLLSVLIAATPMANAQVTVSVAASDAEASETPPGNGQFTVTREGGSPFPVTVTYEVFGTATAGADYAALSGSVTLGFVAPNATITVNVPASDGLFEGDEFVSIRLLESGSVTVTNDTATVDIRDTAHSVTATTGSNATEGPVTPGQILVSLGGQNQSGSAVLVDYTVDGSASPGTDYATLNGVASIPVGSSDASIAVTPIADDLIEGDETVEVTLTASSDARAPIGDPPTASVTITDDDAAGDDDDDGLSNLDECPDQTQCRDTDEDGIPDYQDPDDDGDGVPTASENPPDQDTNSDSLPDYLDNNDDGDGRLTRDEDADADGDGNPATDPTDLDDDNIPDYLDPHDQGGPTGDLDGDGLTNEREAELGTDPENPDTDGDGVGDGDEDAAGTDPLDNLSFEDADGDLVPDAIEVADGTDPNNPASFVDSDGGGTADHIETVTYANFGITATDTLDHNDDQRDFDGDGLPDRLEISIGSEPSSSDSPTADGAGDDTGNGIPNAVEAYLAGLGIVSVTASSDFDRDGYPDAAEVLLALNPLSATASDSDGDGVPNVIELLAGLDINAATDSDADGVPDAREIALNADPLDANSPVVNGALDDDGDGVSNAIEHALQVLGATTDTDENSDTDGDSVGDADEIRAGTDPFHGEQPVPWIELMQAGIGPVNALSSAGGAATATAVIGGHQSGTLVYDWSDTDNAVLAVVSGSQTSKALAFSPATLPAGAYNVVLRVERTIGDFVSPASVVDFTLNVLADAPAADIADADNDGVPDTVDDSDARLGFANALQAQSAAPIQANAGVRLQVGSTARTAQAGSARVTRDHIAAAGDGQGGSVGNSEDEYDYLSGIYDFEVTNLPEAGALVQIVIPQATAIGEFPEYRKYLPGPGWRDFVVDANNLIESAPGSSSACPEPGDAAFQPGLTPGHFCVQLSIEDGGPNDGDAAEGPNGIIKDPGGVGTPKGQVSVGQGGGNIGPVALIMLGLFAVSAAHRRRRRPSGGTMSLTAIGLILGCYCLLAVPPTAHADAFVGAGGGMSLLDPDTAATPFSVEDDQDLGIKIFGGVDLTTISRNLSVEAFWADLGQATLNGNGKIDYSLFGAGVSYGIGSVRAPRLSGFVEAGIARLDASANVPLIQEDDTLMFFGIAGSFAIRRHLFLQLEYEYFAEDAQFLSLSIVKRFRWNTSDARTMPLPDR
ncbi:MAG: Calx-beta domain-containing protein [Woeseia sp.]